MDAACDENSGDPLLALYVWRGGNLAAKSEIVGKKPGAPRR